MDAQVKHHLALGRDYYNTGEYELAKPHLEAVLESHADFADVHNMLGVIDYEAGEPARARESFERALAINPRYTEASLNLAVVYNELGRYDDARRVYGRAQGERRSIGLGSLDAFVRGKLANMHAELGDAYTGVGLLEHAIAEFRRALALCPTFVDIRTKLATTLRDVGRVEDAIDEFIGLRESAPEYFPARVHFGVTLWRAGRLEDARSEWAAVLEQDPSNRSCKMYLRMAELSAGHATPPGPPEGERGRESEPLPAFLQPDAAEPTAEPTEG